MPFRKAAAATALALAVAVAGSLSSCSQASPHPAGPSSVKQVKAAVTQGKAPAYSVAITEVNDYLATWHQHGAQAAQRFLVQAERGPDPIVLRSGKVVSYQPYRWASQDSFTLLVILDLHFVGSSGAWNSGSNGRFITFSRPAGHSQYLMYFATGP